MKKILFIVLIFVVVGIVGVFVYGELNDTDLRFVRDFTTNGKDGADYAIVRRLYSSNIHTEEFSRAVESRVIEAEFDEEEVAQGALDAGTPRFYPAFYFATSLDKNYDGIILNCKALREIAPKQFGNDFRISKLSVEITSDIPIDKYEIIPADPNQTHTGLINVSDTNKNTLVLDLSESTEYILEVPSKNANLRFLYSYNVASAGAFPKTILEGEILAMTVNTADGVSKYELMNIHDREGLDEEG